MNYPAPFTQNQYDYMQRCFYSWFNVAEGVYDYFTTEE